MVTKCPAIPYNSLVFDAYAYYLSLLYFKAKITLKTSKKMIGVTRGVTRGVTHFVQKLTDKRGINAKKTLKTGFFFG